MPELPAGFVWPRAAAGAVAGATLPLTYLVSLGAYGLWRNGISIGTATLLILLVLMGVGMGQFLRVARGDAAAKAFGAASFFGGTIVFAFLSTLPIPRELLAAVFAIWLFNAAAFAVRIARKTA